MGDNIKDFLAENMPLSYHTVFTLRIFKGKAQIVGSIAACDACNRVIKCVEGPQYNPFVLTEAALLLARIQPPKDRLVSAVEGILKRLDTVETAKIA